MRFVTVYNETVVITDNGVVYGEAGKHLLELELTDLQLSNVELTAFLESLLYEENQNEGARGIPPVQHRKIIIAPAPRKSKYLSVDARLGYLIIAIIAVMCVTLCHFFPQLITVKP